MNQIKNENILTVGALSASRLESSKIMNNSEIIYVRDSKVIEYLAQAFHVSFKILIPGDRAFGVLLPDNNWTGILGMIQRTEVDIAVPSFAYTEERCEVFNFSYPYFFSEVTFMTNKPEPVSGNMTLFYPFSAGVWILLAFCIFTLSLFCFFLLRRKESYARILFKTFGSVLEKTLLIKTKERSLKMAMGFWLIAAFVITNSYKAVLLAFLLVPPLSGIRDISDLANAADQNLVSCYIDKGSAFEKVLLDSKFDTWKSIGRCLQRTAESSTNDWESFLKAKTKKAFIAAKALLKPYEKEYHISEDSFFLTVGAIPTSKKFCCLKKLDHFVHRFLAAGLYQKILNDENMLIQLKRKPLNPYEVDVPKKLGISDLKGAFILLITGYILAFIILVIEILIKYFLCNDN